MQLSMETKIGVDQGKSEGKKAKTTQSVSLLLKIQKKESKLMSQRPSPQPLFR